MPSFDLEFEVFCSCGAALCRQSETRISRNRGMPQVVVEACEDCLERAQQKGYDAGYDAAKKETP